jgi:hypothetical protein
MSCLNIVIGHPLVSLAMDSRQKHAGMTGLRRRFEKVSGGKIQLLAMRFVKLFLQLTFKPW